MSAGLGGSHRVNLSAGSPSVGEKDGEIMVSSLETSKVVYDIIFA